MTIVPMTTLKQVVLDDQEVNTEEAIQEKLADAMTPGFQVEFDPDEAECAGAFVEDALSEQDAADSDADLVDATAPAIEQEG